MPCEKEKMRSFINELAEIRVESKDPEPVTTLLSPTVNSFTFLYVNI